MAAQIVQTRNDMLKLFPKGMAVMEIGVFLGEFSQILLDTLEPKKLHLVDPFCGIVESGDKDGENVVSADLAIEYENVRSRFKHRQNVLIHKCYSSEIEFPDNYFDLIYIDGDHSYCGVRHDLHLSFCKLKNGGILSGHDYTPRFFGCMKAVDEFCQKFNQSIDVLTQDGCPSFAITIRK